MTNTEEKTFLSEEKRAGKLPTGIDADEAAHIVLNLCCISEDEMTECRQMGNPQSDILLKKVRLLYQNNEIEWIEAMADFQERQAECLLKDRKEAVSTFMKAFAICRWMSEESNYLPAVHPITAGQMREQLFQRMDRLRLKLEVCDCIAEGQTKTFFEDTLRRLEASGHLWHAEEVMEKIISLLSFDSVFLSHSLPLVTLVLNRFQKAGLLTSERKKCLSGILEERINIQEAYITTFWFSDNPEKLHTLITESLRLLALAYLLADTDQESHIPMISARICRYLSRLPSAYSELLKNKAYTLLAGETKLNGRIRWEDVCHFDEKRFLEQIVLFRLDGEDPHELFEPENKWAQCHSETNTLTLDRDGFTLSTYFVHNLPSWKGRKDKASVLNNRFFISSFSKLLLTFDACKNIKDFRAYWKQLEEDFPTAYIRPRSIVHTINPEQEEDALLTTSLYPEYDQKVTVRVLFVDTENQCLRTEIIDKEYRGMKANLPFGFISGSFALIPGFAGMFCEGMRFTAHVRQADNREIKLSMTQEYNEFVYAECMRQRNLTARVVELFDGKILWLLSSGATAVTGQIVSNKFKPGDYYKAWYNGLDPNKQKTIIKIQLRTEVVDEKDFLQAMADNWREFLTCQTRDSEILQDWEKEAQELKEKNNPFVIALQNLNFGFPDKVYTEESTPALPGCEKETELALFPRMDMRLTRELVYCLDSLTDNIDNLDEKFNTFNALSLLSRFIGDKALSDHYQLCSDYIYQIYQLTDAPFEQRFTRENVEKFSLLLKRMEVSDISRYNCRFGPCEQVIQVLKALFASNPLLALHAYTLSPDPTVSELARYFCITLYLRDSDEMLQRQAYKNINQLLGLKDTAEENRSYIPVFFGHEGVQKEFKTSAFVHAEKNAGEVQFVVLARVLASFMNTDGGTLYIGVNDSGYLNGLAQELEHTHNDSDVYLRTVNNQVIRLLGERDDWNRYQEYIRSRLYEYEDGRQVLALRAAPIREVVKVKGDVYTRSASSNTIKPVPNVPEFVKYRSKQELDSTPRQPEFPSYYSPDRHAFIFGTATQARPFAEPEEMEDEVDIILPEEDILSEPAEELALPFVMDALKKSAPKSGKFHYEIATSALRNNPLQKKGEHGYTPKHLFVSIFNNGKIAYSPSPKIGVWGEDKGKVIFSYNPDEKEELLVSVFSSGQVGISNLKKGMSQPNTPTVFLASPEGMFFLSPAHKKDYLLLISEKEDEIRYRLILLDGFGKSMGIQPEKMLILEPDKGTFIYAEIIPSEQMRYFADDKVSLDDYDQYNGGRFWSHSAFEQDVKLIGQLCKFSG